MIRCFDFFISFVGLIFFSPLLIFIFFIGLFENGSPLFVQSRVGYNLKSFSLIKFRTMPVGVRSAGTHLVKNIKLSFFGSFLRRTKLDEIPQLLNVLKRDMSLVGPRPYLKAHDHLFRKSYKSYRIRQFVKPGVTGPAQCRGLRGEFTDDALVSKRIELDFAYVGSWSIWTDMIIILRTVGQVLFPPKSAY